MFNLIGRISPAQAKVVLRGVDKSSKRTVKVTRILPDPSISLSGHVLVSILFYGLFLAHVITATMHYMDSPTTTTQTLVPSNHLDIPPLFAYLSVSCKQGTGSTAAENCGNMLLSANYSNFPTSPCYSSEITVWNGGTKQSTHPFSSSSSSSAGGVFDLVMTQNNPNIIYQVPLCYTSQESLKLSGVVGDDESSSNLPLSMIQIGFQNLSSGGAELHVKIEGIPSTATTKRLVNVNNDHSVRVLPISGSLEQEEVSENDKEKKIISFIPSADVIQFEGFRPSSSSSHRSDVLIVMQSMTTLRTQHHIASLWGLVSNIGSTFQTLMGFMPIVVPLLSWVFFAKGNWLRKFIASATDKIQQQTSRSSYVVDMKEDENAVDAQEMIGGGGGKNKFLTNDSSTTATHTPSKNVSYDDLPPVAGGNTQNNSSNKSNFVDDELL